MPGPMFTLASYLGAMLVPSAPGRVWRRGNARHLLTWLAGISHSPGVAVLQTQPRLRAAISAINASVVGLRSSPPCTTHC